MKIKLNKFNIIHCILLTIQITSFGLYLLNVIEYSLALRIAVSAAVMAIANAFAEDDDFHHRDGGK